MRIESIEQMCCPQDKAELELTIVGKDLQGNVLEGFFNCSECKRIYPIVKGIPIMNPDEYREFELEKTLLDQWEGYLEGKKVENFRLIEKEN